MMNLINVARDTVAICKKDKNTSSVWMVNDLQVPFTNKNAKTYIKVENTDYITLAYNLAGQYSKVAILNMCSNFKPGGGLWKGASAGEEELCRRTSLYQQLMFHEREYPFRDRKLIYSKNVTIFKSEGLYTRLKPERDVDVISIAALRNPKLKNPDTYQNTDDFIDMRERIDAILNVAARNGVDCLVLSAFGSGCFNNPPNKSLRFFAIAFLILTLNTLHSAF